jgi:hypothetical protein
MAAERRTPAVRNPRAPLHELLSATGHTAHQDELAAAVQAHAAPGYITETLRRLCDVADARRLQRTSQSEQQLGKQALKDLQIERLFDAVIAHR